MTTSSRSAAARRARQLGELGRGLAAWSAGRAVIAGGDFNLSHCDSAGRRLLEEFAVAHGLRDSRPDARGDCGVGQVDYILYRSGDGVTLDLLEAGEAPEFAADSHPLSDHPAIHARFRVR